MPIAPNLALPWSPSQRTEDSLLARPWLIPLEPIQVDTAFIPAEGP
jgi:hypothetical protein